MRAWDKRYFTIFLLVITAFIHWFSRDAQRVEQYYSISFFPSFALFLRSVTGWIPFSAGDIIYAVLLLFVIARLVRRAGRLHGIQHRITVRKFGDKIFSYLNTFLLLYIFFNLVWGINYNRKSIAKQLNLKMQPYTRQELSEMSCLLTLRINESRAAIIKPYPSDARLFEMVEEGYDSLALKHPFLAYEKRSIKPSIWGILGNYVGFTGYYNPFTGEAQVCTDFPRFLLPYTACHEVAHQLGYAKEMEANFVGYLAASSSKDPLLHYSVYLDLFMYANRNLRRTDSVTARLHREELSQEVQDDIEEWRKFSAVHRNPVEPYFRWLYGKFLEHNQQPQGMMSYDQVTGFIIAYYKKFGRI